MNVLIENHLTVKTVSEAPSSLRWAGPGVLRTSSATWTRAGNLCRMLGLLRRKVSHDNKTKTS